MNVRRHRLADDPAYPAAAAADDPALAALRDQSDPDALVEALTDRLRRQFPTTLAADEWGRPVAYRHVVRAALSALPPHVTRELAERMTEQERPADPGPMLDATPVTVSVIDLVRQDQVAAGVGWPEQIAAGPLPAVDPAYDW